MDAVDLNFKVTLSDFREASYYGLFLRRRNTFRAAAAVLLACFVCAVLWFHRPLPAQPVVLFIGCAYLIWVLFLLGGTERQILRYAKSPDTLISAEYRARFGGGSFSIEIPGRGFHVSGGVSQLTCAFELSRCFLLYATRQQLFIVPIRQMSQAEIMALRQILREGLNDRFSTPFGRRKR